MVECGNEVTKVRVGDRVTVEPLLSCGRCENCLDGRSNVCDKVLLIGGELPGGFGEYAAVHESCLIKLPEGMPIEHGALAEPVATSVHAIRRLHGRHYRRAVILGSGTVGMITMLVLRRHVERIVMTDVDESRLQKALALGADEVINAEKQNAVEQALELSGGQRYDLIIDAAGFPSTRQQGFDLIKNGGDYVVLGLGERFHPVDFQRLATGELNLIGSQCHVKEDFDEAFRLLMDGTVEYDRIVTQLPLSKAPYAFANPRIDIKINFIPDESR